MENKQWEEYYLQLCNYCERHHRIPREKEDKILYSWLLRCRTSYDKDRLSYEKIEKLDNLLSDRWRVGSFEARSINMYMARQIVVPEMEGDIGIDVLWNKMVISDREFLNFIREDKYYLSQIIVNDLLPLEQSYEGIRLVYRLPEFGWYRVWSILECLPLSDRYVDCGFTAMFDINWYKLRGMQPILSAYVNKDIKSINSVRCVEESFSNIRDSIDNRRYEIFIKRFVCDKNIKDLAEEYGCSKANISRLIEDSIQKTRNAYKKFMS